MRYKKTWLAGILALCMLAPLTVRGAALPEAGEAEAAEMSGTAKTAEMSGTAEAEEAEESVASVSAAEEAEEAAPGVDPSTIPGDGAYLGMNFEGTAYPVQIFGDTEEGVSLELYESPKASHPRASEYTQRFGIDVSRWQYDIDWDAVKEDGVEFVIVKVAGRNLNPDEETGEYELYEDPYFRRNLTGAAKAGLKVGAYFYSQAINEEEAIEEAKYMIDKVVDYHLDLPIFFDYEWSGDKHRIYLEGGDLEDPENNRKIRTAVVDAFCRTIQERGYAVGIYANDNCFTNFLNTYDLAEKYKIWLAHYVGNPEKGAYPDLPSDKKWYQGSVDFYQYTSSLYVEGITQNRVDHNLWYDDGTVNGSKDYSRVFRAAYYAAQNPDVVEEFGTEPSELLLHFLNFGMKEGRVAKETFDVYAYQFYNRDVYEAFGRNMEKYYEHFMDRGYREGRISTEPVNARGRIAMFRLYNPYTGEHFFTSDVVERNQMVKDGWAPEAVAWYAPEESDFPVYRLYNPYTGEHLFTTDMNERDTLIPFGWEDEEIGWYSSEGGLAVARLFNPYVKKRPGAHHFTTDQNEVSALLKKGWRDEGTAWYGME